MPVIISEEQLIELNKLKIADENAEIEGFFKNRQWQMEKTDRGVFFRIYEKGRGREIKTGNEIFCEYTLSLITGEVIYHSKNEGILNVVVGKNDLPSGLEEAILKLHQGDKANIIVPSYLAYGLAGDSNKIPSAATLIYDIYITQVNN
jgi:FKBP-type peptidyl-prolyl cis-trans isomerase